ncbi:hemerythrin domain-containing protein [Nocardia sp. NPDC052566]|uniref:hemerythrin domain-containing protein n=1 Tax=Nocardia sp. NPDC052566 TaxID=3364330 RepID=UPI0037CBF1C7
MAFEMSRAAMDSPGCETQDMVLVHRVFTREFGLLGRIVTATPARDVEQAGRVAAHAREMLAALHHHHTSEDELVWPRLRAADIDPALVDRMQAQHEAMDEPIHAVESNLGVWARTADPEIGARLADAFVQLHRVLTEHLVEEENSVLPIVARTMTATQWAELAKRGMASMSKSRGLVFLGHIHEEADAHEWSAFTKEIPPPVRLLYRVLGKRGHARETALLRRDLPTR